MNDDAHQLLAKARRLALNPVAPLRSQESRIITGVMGITVFGYTTNALEIAKMSHIEIGHVRAILARLTRAGVFAMPRQGDYGLCNSAYEAHGRNVDAYMDMLKVHDDAASPDQQQKNSFCSICFDQPSAIAFTACGHVCICVDCLPVFEADLNTVHGENRERRCPICRIVNITAPIRVYF